ncbi:MAG: type I restriction enzyme HsdR N-terminal domain-containing protein [Anditalea sp.]
MKEPLNLPSCDFQIKDEEGKLSIFDALRKKFLMLTPEEWVRQHVIYYLITHKQYPRSLFSLEKGIKYNQIQKRFDILVLDREGNPFLLVECKAPDIKLSQKTAEQIAVYNQTVGAKYLAISNGKRHICLEFNAAAGSFKQLREFPAF